MTYEQAVQYLYAQLPMFTRDGASAFKKDLTNTYRLCAALGNPQEKFRSIHIAGTNGKGSTSHMLAAILQAAGYKTGLYTSPHLLDFRERIRINGALIPEETVATFVSENLALIAEIQPSFFEVTVAMAFTCFARQQVDIAVIETGLGGRLDSTNVITPLLSVITNIGYDHTNILGNTLPEIAREKAGIIKQGVPVVVGQRQEELAGIFEQTAAEHRSQLVFADEQWQIDIQPVQAGLLPLDTVHRQTGDRQSYELDLTGSYQSRNLPGVLSAVAVLRRQGFEISDAHVQSALRHVQKLTGLMGRWQKLATDPLIICDTGHNADGWQAVLANIAATPHRRLYMVIGVMRDKDLDMMLPLLPREAYYCFCAVDMPRALPAAELYAAGNRVGLQGEVCGSVADALAAARQKAQPTDLVFVGGSTFVVADALSALGFKA